MAMQYAKLKGMLIEEALDMPLSVLLVNFAIEANKRAEENYQKWSALPAKEQSNYPDMKDHAFTFKRNVRTKTKA